MRKISVVFAMVALAATAAEGKGREGQQAITVYIDKRPDMPASTLPVAEAIASGIFAKVGIHVAWKAGRPRTEMASPTIILDITADGPASSHPGALAYAHEFEGVHIVVFYDRLQSMATRELRPTLLGHVLAHEITHILEGVDHHSPEGIMKAHWTSEDIAKMAYRPLPFNPLDVELIHLGFARRSTAR